MWHKLTGAIEWYWGVKGYSYSPTRNCSSGHSSFIIHLLVVVHHPVGAVGHRRSPGHRLSPGHLLQGLRSNALEIGAVAGADGVGGGRGAGHRALLVAVVQAFLVALPALGHAAAQSSTGRRGRLVCEGLLQRLGSRGGSCSAVSSHLGELPKGTGSAQLHGGVASLAAAAAVVVVVVALFHLTNIVGSHEVGGLGPDYSVAQVQRVRKTDNDGFSGRLWKIGLAPLRVGSAVFVVVVRHDGITRAFH
ncbi:hypothetical protein N7488_011400 [Penicillium malachiteum]|nr:hypothetical protein N7488_011400 [Penicillium malachiteum]